jgi:hypothetical protein
MINSAIILSAHSWYLVGYSPEYLYTKTGGATLPFKMSFIYNPDPDINILVDDVVFGLIKYEMTWRSEITKSSVSITGTISP